MKILFISPTFPVPISGGRTRLYNIIKQLSIRHEVSLISFLQPSDQDYIGQIEPFCENLELVQIEDYASAGKWRNRVRGWGQILLSNRPKYVQTFPVEEMRHPLRRMLEDRAYDVVGFEQLFLVELKSELHNIPSLLIEQNIESDISARRMQQADNPVHKLRDRLIWQRLVQFERHWLRQFPVCVAVSPHDADRIGELAPAQSVIVVPNGVDCEYFDAESNDRSLNTVLFFGSLSYQPNIDAVIWFCHEVWPHVHSALPDIEFEIVGLQPGPRIARLADLPGVHLTGFVPDIRQKLWSSSLSVVPLRIGGGTRIKILEAMAASCPVVSTAIGAEGLEVEDGKHLQIANSGKEFIDKTVELLKSPDKRAKLAQAGRELTVEKYDWQVLAPRLEYALAKTIEIYATTTN
ncbi:MAG: glycosyltransferase family 4 protein [Candidatus Promineifilaceae bacterium]